ncbi:MAG TPA: GNAT family N-acetyltransferase [Candidatus Moranbacteria bacterium]|jgi:ribosomal protein S18 acetylase RimI-like enzyme|nr:GNAT family N-acetyltransferase [Candidatus Moranbacteria bacterium]HRY27987.1 GNAT family N-acetyltransferase [Candidatus Moranbacteria bacterium]HSA08197.1 GNAT family N-acetyltransferase [Candidatus Moranbacteria bacterium]
MNLEIKTYIKPTADFLCQVESLHNNAFLLSPWRAGYLEKFFAKKEKLPILCTLERKELLCGYIIGKARIEKDEFLVHSFLISDEFRGKGWGKKLMKNLLSYIEKNTKIKNVVVNFRSSNSVINFYGSLGFSSLQTCETYKNGEQKISMIIPTKL